MCVVAEVTTALGRMDGALGEGVFTSERASTHTCDVVVGEGAVFEGVTGSEVVVCERSGPGGVKLLVAMVVFLPCIDTDQKGGWVEGVGSGPRDSGHGSVSLGRVVPFESQGGECP